MAMCDAPLSEIQDECVRTFFAALLPSILVVVIILGSSPIPYPSFLRKTFQYLSTPFIPFLSLSQAEAIHYNVATPSDINRTEPSNNRISALRTGFIIVPSLIESLVWLGYGGYSVSLSLTGHWVDLAYPFVIAATWIYASVRPFVRPISTTPFDLFLLFFIHESFSVIDTIATIYNVFALALPPPKWDVLALNILKLIASAVTLVAVLGTPLSVPSQTTKSDVLGDRRTPEDSTTLWSWLSFSWMEPLIKEGSSRMLNEEDVYNLSLTTQSKPVFVTFSNIKSKTLLRRLFHANRFDLLFDFTLTIVSVVFNYASPFFLNQILSAFEDESQGGRSRGYVFACLSFVCLLAKAQSDAQHLYFGRRAATRTRSELMASVYDKALKRRDLSGTLSSTDTDKKSGDTKDQQKGTKDSKSKRKNEAGADLGKVVNLMSGDSNRVASFVSSAYFLYGAPFEIIIACTFLFKLLGWAAFAGFFVLVLTSPLNHYLSKRGVKIGRELLAARDKRMAVLNELMGGIKFIKFFAWEEQFIERVEVARGKELKSLIKERTNSIMFNLLWTVAPVLVSVISFLTYTVIQGKELTVPVAFTAIALFNMLKMPLNVIPTFIVQALQASVALERIENFLTEEEVPDEVSSLKRPTFNSLSVDGRLGAENASFRWIESDASSIKSHSQKGSDRSPHSSGEDDRKFELSDISVIFPEGQLSVITGPTASGKSALLLAILGELTLLPGGQIYLPKDPSRVDEFGLTSSISYCAQTPWLQHMSIKENILFGSPFEKERYEQVLECCALNPDLAILEDGDETEIGARGVTLSGGQKARVALARAAYSRTKNVLLDDIFAAVDSHTAQTLWEKLFCGPLLAHRTVVLVTHHLDVVLEGASYLVRMLDGRIDFQGAVNDLRSQGILESIVHDATEESQTEHAPLAVPDAVGEEPATEEAVKSTAKARKLVKEEARASGNVKWSVYRAYLKACSYYIWGFLLIMIVVYQLNTIGEKLWIRQWGLAYEVHDTWASRFSSLFLQHQNMEYPEASGHYVASGTSNTSVFTSPLPSAHIHPMFYVLIYSCITLGGSFLSTINTTVQYVGAFNASRRLFTALLVNVVQAPMRWFDTTPQGRILNRFGSDIATIDSSISSSIRATTQWIASFIAAILTVAVVLPVFLPAAFIIGYFYYKLSLGYIKTGRDLRRMESNSRSPIFASFGELLDGIVTVRAFSAETRFFDVLHRKVDVTTKMWYGFWMLNRYLLLHFDFLSATSILLTTLFALSGAVDAGTAGLTITSAMAFTTSAYWTCRFITQLEMDTNAVERVVEYLHLPQEPPAVITESRPPAYWPSTSNESDLVHVEDLVIRYSPELDPVIKGVSFTLKGRERVGLIGRTGSGKSTLAMSLLRFVDPSGGRIIVDGIDITTIGLRDLRSRLTIIPQDAVLFSGTIRDNLDPFSEHTDDEVLDVLLRVQLVSPSEYTSRRSSRVSTRVPSRATSVHEGSSESTSSTDSDEAVGSPPATLNDEQRSTVRLDTNVNAGGLNFSQGQRQLIAMARALLRQSAVVIMDEATVSHVPGWTISNLTPVLQSSIDFKTDASIQRAIREEFKSSLLITIAHRLRTVIDYDRIMVMDRGNIVELDTPANLILKEGGVFREMCLKSGDFEKLRAIAVGQSQIDAS